jgi:hypothetical protein
LLTDALFPIEYARALQFKRNPAFDDIPAAGLMAANVGSLSFSTFAIEDFFVRDKRSMSRTNLGTTLYRFWSGLFKIWSFFLYIFHKQYKTVRGQRPSSSISPSKSRPFLTQFFLI